MMWTGSWKKNEFKKRILHQIDRQRAVKALKRVWTHRTYKQFYRRHLNVHIPAPWNFLIFRKYLQAYITSFKTQLTYRLVFTYSTVYYCMCPVPIQWRTLYQNKFNSGIEMNARQESHYTTLYFLKFNNLFSSLHRPFFHKLKFKGKGYYMYRNWRNTITPQLGHAHRILTYTFYLQVMFFRRGTTRRSILLVGRLKEHLQKAAWRIRQMRRQNIFTGRGVRFARSSIYRKPGKISTYR